jgi:NDP-4-keto-2,6-dideoxyhexose 3-C-methyltransferase
MQVEQYIKGAAERDEHKWGLKMVGTWIPIVPEEEARKDATVFLVLPWHFREAIEVREHDWVMNGGKLLFPLPTPVMCSAEGEVQLLTQSVGGIL